MAYKRPLVMTNGLIQELQASDLLDQSAVIVGPAFGGNLTSGQVPYANSTTTVLCSANLTFDGSTLTAANLATGYTQATGGIGNTLRGLCIPLGSTAATNFLLLDCNDAFALLDLVGSGTATPTQDAGTLSTLFRRDPTGLVAPTWTTGGVTSIVLVLDPNGTLARGSYFNLNLNFQANYNVPTHIKIEGWDNTANAYAGGYTTEYDADVTITGTSWVSPAINGLGNLSTLGTFKVTLTVPNCANGLGFSLTRIVLTNPSTVFDPWSLPRSGGTVLGNLAVTGTAKVTGVTTLGTANVTSAAISSLTLGAAGSLYPVDYPPPMLINASLNLYVATTGSDTTGDGTVDNPWKTISQALAVLGNYTISPNVTVTINVAFGIYTGVPAIVVNHPQGAQIIISGAITNTTTVSSVTSFGAVSGGKATVVIVVANATGITINSYLLITPAASIGTLSGTCTHWWNLFGCHKVTGVSGTSITITVNTYTASAASSAGTLTGLTAIPVTVLNTVLNFGANNGFVAYNLVGGAVAGDVSWNLGKVAYLALIGQSSSTMTAVMPGNLALVNVGINNWGHGVYSPQGALVYVIGCAVSGCGAGGIYLSNSCSLLYVNSVANGNGASGCLLQYNSTAYFTSSAFVGNTGNGLWVSSTSSSIFVTSISCDNTTSGIGVTYGSSVLLAGGVISGNTSNSLYANIVSVTTSGSSCTISGTQSPAQGTPGNNGSYNLA